MINFTMRFYVQQTPDGNYHVQNFIGGLKGQHHVHTPQSYEMWKKDTDDIIILKPGSCDCGLTPGDVREYSGRTWHNPKFE